MMVAMTPLFDRSASRITVRIMIVFAIISLSLIAWASWAGYSESHACQARGGVILDRECVSRSILK